MKKFSAFFAILILCSAAFWGFYDLMPHQVKEAKSLSDFSIENALSHLKIISEKPHAVGTIEHKKVQNYLFDELEKMGLNPSIQYQTAANNKWFAATTVENIVARIKGTDNEKALLLLSHYDSNPHSSKGASDAGSGIVTILEGVRAFLAVDKQPKNDIVILFSDAEELGLLGSKAFVNHHPWAKDVGLVLNFEARGSGGPSYMLMETNGKNQKLIESFLHANPKNPAANSLMYSVYKKLPNDTDLTVFREDANINGFNFAFIGDHFDYHTIQDSYERLDRETLQHQADYLLAMLNYFSFHDLYSLDSDTDHVYVNFPIIKMIHFPFSWVLPFLIACSLLFLFLVFWGIGLSRLQLKNILVGFIPAILALVLNSLLSYFLWRLLLIIYPSYNDVLHGFTYNGYWYIGAFSFLTLSLTFFIYKPFYKKHESVNLFIAPIFIWLLINFLLLNNFIGGAFFIIPVGIALLILGIEIFKKDRRKQKTLLYAVLSVPSLYIFSPMVVLFPVGLGLKNLFISSIFIALLFGILLPVLSKEKIRKKVARLAFLSVIIFSVIATLKSDFTVDQKKPNSLVYVEDGNKAFWATYNHVLDDYTKQKLGETPKKGTIESALTKSKYNTPIRYFSNTTIKNIPKSIISIVKDTVIGKNRNIRVLIHPQRKVNKYELSVLDSLTFYSAKVNGASINKDRSFTASKGSFLIYHMGNSDGNLDFSFEISNEVTPTIIVNEISYDLLKNPQFEIQPRSEKMMPMPFVTNDAIMCIQKIEL